MSNYNPVPEGKDPVLWQIAQKRTSFNTHAITYIIINAFLWAVWYFTGNNFNGNWGFNYPLPIWTTIGWGIGLAFHFASAYVFPLSNSTEREYERLINKQ